MQHTKQTTFPQICILYKLILNLIDFKIFLNNIVSYYTQAFGEGIDLKILKILQPRVNFSIITLNKKQFIMIKKAIL